MHLDLPETSLDAGDGWSTIQSLTLKDVLWELLIFEREVNIVHGQHRNIFFADGFDLYVGSKLEG